ncbi:hypothetical protein FB559_1468 [Actinoallomurus bryophytorum]|uniref:Uncharacterized protein n=1 Tax=Actinoallomurus bryophytorum TaxID=1490222 RepID=A0A543CFS1_9ACTN|nr:hypothetical protein FB559_1468 [Actinoallomurus bryophytorum]
MHLVLISPGVLHLILNQGHALPPPSDVRDPGPQPSGYFLDGDGGGLGVIGDRVRAFDDYGTDRPRHGDTLLVKLLQPGKHGSLIEVIIEKGIQE